MQITGLRATTHSVPVHVPLIERETYVPIVFVHMETDEGIDGYGLTGRIQRFGVKEFINKKLAVFLKGKSPVETEALWHQMHRNQNPRSQTGPIAAGQNEGSRFRHLELLLNRSVDVLQPNVCYIGGYTEAMKVAGTPQEFNVPVANVGGWPHHNMHLQAAVANGIQGVLLLDMEDRRSHIQKFTPARKGLGYAA